MFNFHWPSHVCHGKVMINGATVYENNKLIQIQHQVGTSIFVS